MAVFSSAKLDETGASCGGASDVVKFLGAVAMMVAADDSLAGTVPLRDSGVDREAHAPKNGTGAAGVGIAAIGAAAAAGVSATGASIVRATAIERGTAVAVRGGCIAGSACVSDAGGLDGVKGAEEGAELSHTGVAGCPRGASNCDAGSDVVTGNLAMRGAIDGGGVSSDGAGPCRAVVGNGVGSPDVATN